MKKFGFTLSEILIAMGIIGVVAAATAPTLNMLLPDRNKSKVLKAYHVITTTTNSLLRNPSLYPGDGIVQFWENGRWVECEGLACGSLPYDWNLLLISKYPEITNANVNTFRNALQGRSKYINLLALNMEISTPHNNNATLYANGVNANFVTEDGLRWIIRVNDSGSQAIIKVDANDRGGDVGPNQTYTDNQQNPDRFSFYVDQFGRVKPNDALTQAYIENPKKLNDKTVDFERASNIHEVWQNF